jgi:tRNA pseudouridine55 synthase
MDGLLVIDKPAGPTSHDVVVRLRRALRERRVGHTGTLDPAASGVLPLVVGRATRLAQFISAGDKGYRAVLRLGVRTDSGDAEGEAIGEPWRGPLPDAAAIELALESFRGSFAQLPPAFSAKKIDGRRSYELARARRTQLRGSVSALAPPDPTPHADATDRQGRRAERNRPDPVRVTVHRLSLERLEGDRLTLELECSAGFYVRSLADDLGQRLGVGAHLIGLCRTRHGELTLTDAVALADVERNPARALASLIPMRRLLTSLEAVRLTPEGVESAAHGRALAPAAFAPIAEAGHRPSADPEADRAVRLLSPAGDLVGIARRSGAGGLLHPFVVLM